MFCGLSATDRMSIIYPRTIFSQNYMNCPKSASMAESLQFSPQSNRFIMQIPSAKSRSFLISNKNSGFWKDFLKNTFLPHLLATLLIFLLFCFKENLLIDLCWLDKSECRTCPAKIKYAYLFSFVSLEYIVPIDMQFFVVFSSSKTKLLYYMIIFYFIFCYFVVYFWYIIWDFKILVLFDTPTPDFLVYISVILCSLSLCPLIIKEIRTTFLKYRKRMFFNGLFVIYTGSCMTVLSYLMKSVHEILKEFDSVFFQIFVLLFLWFFEQFSIWFCLKNYRHGYNDWNGNNLTVISYSKPIFLSIYAFRIANFSFVSRVNLAFYFHIFSFVAFLIEILTGKSLIKRFITFCQHLFFKLILPLRKKRLKFTKIRKIKFLDAQCLKIIGYQKFDLMFCYLPRIFSFIIFKKWTISQPSADTVEGCTNYINKELQLNFENIYIFIVVDILFMIMMVWMVKKNKIKMSFFYQTEKISFGTKVLYYMGNQLYFEFLLMYCITMNSYK